MNKIKLLFIISFILVLAFILGVVFMYIQNDNYSRPTNIDVFYRFMRKTDINQIDFEKAYALGLSDSKKEINKEYLKQQDAYREILFDYINRQIDFKEFDKEIANLEVSQFFRSVKKPLKDISDREMYYSSLSHLDSEYLYIHNDIHIERLSDEEFQTLKDIKSGEIVDEVEKEKFLKKTLVRVISYYGEGKDNFAVQYRVHGGGAIKSDILHSSLLFSIEYRKPKNSGTLDYYFDENTAMRESERQKYEELVPKYEHIFSEKLGVKVQIENSLYSNIRLT
ncbi:hypothetical protein [Streptococcus sanguinis]|nr:hypothetical protein [Streptococcus sanguinis]